MRKPFKKTILIDLDGVLNMYTGNFDKNYIPPASNGAKEFLSELSLKYNIVIFTTREKELTPKWVKDYKMDKYITDITNTKEPCYLYIDDRCIKFNGDFQDLKMNINNFQVWWKVDN